MMPLDVTLPPLTVDDLLRMLGERDVRIDQLTRRVLALEAQRTPRAAPPPDPPHDA